VYPSIIASGIDLPNVNTLIVDDADRFGLTQLYQLRGRVGRGATRAYAYFIYNRGKQLTEVARRRLEAILEATELGSGFRIAMKDLEIRGAGNILGAQQSGHMGVIGFDLYCQLLSEAVVNVNDELELPTPVFETTIDLPLDAYIPDEYVADLDTRLTLYLRLTKMNSVEEVDEISGELEDRYGTLPLPFRNILYIIVIKMLASGLGIPAISSERGQVVLKLGPETKIDRAQLERAFGEYLKIGATQLRLDMKRLGAESKGEKEWQWLLREMMCSLSRGSAQSQQGSESSGSH